jgi:phosphonate transport system substrate-binding protein
MNDDTVYQMTVSPDFTPARLVGWYVFNTWLQRSLEMHFHCEMYNDFETQRVAIRADKVDLIYANPLDATMLVREKNFTPVARAQGVTDECIIAVAVGSPVLSVEALKPQTRVAYTNDEHINLIGMIMLESADLGKDNIVPVVVDNYILIAKALITNTADIGFFPKDTWNEFSNAIRKELRPLVTSQISDIQHVLIAGPRLAALVPKLREQLQNMVSVRNGASVLESLGFQGWEGLAQEDTEFMIDLIDTLKA